MLLWALLCTAHAAAYTSCTATAALSSAAAPHIIATCSAGVLAWLQATSLAASLHSATASTVASASPSTALGPVFVAFVASVTQAVLGLMTDEGLQCRSTLSLTILSALVLVAAGSGEGEGVTLRSVVVPPLVDTIRVMQRLGGPLRVDAFSVLCQFHDAIPELATGPQYWYVHGSVTRPLHHCKDHTSHQCCRHTHTNAV